MNHKFLVMLKKAITLFALANFSIFPYKFSFASSAQIFTNPVPQKTRAMGVGNNGILKIENNCVYFMSFISKKTFIPIFPNGSKVQENLSIVIPLKDSKKRYIPINKSINVSQGYSGLIKHNQEKNYSNCIKKTKQFSYIW